MSSRPYFGVSATRFSMFAKLAPSGQDQPTEEFENAWREFINKYTPLLFGVCRSFGIQNSDAEDITQSTILKVISLLREEKFEYDSQHHFRAWLSTVTSNAIRDGYRKMKRVQHDCQEYLDSIPENTLATKVELEVNQEYLLSQALERLEERSNPDHWQVFKVRVLENRSTIEAAKILSKSPGNVDVICSRRRIELRRIWDELICESESSESNANWLRSTRPLE
jgi:RNA polymerase sigma factor (sigma-70 family)